MDIGPQPVAIVGGGIGGLACGLMLNARGISCAVFEQAVEIRELGVGINLLSHAVSMLAPFGLLGASIALRSRRMPSST